MARKGEFRPWDPGRPSEPSPLHLSPPFRASTLLLPTLREASLFGKRGGVRAMKAREEGGGVGVAGAV